MTTGKKDAERFGAGAFRTGVLILPKARGGVNPARIKIA